MKKSLLYVSLVGVFATLSGCTSMTPIAASAKQDVQKGEGEISSVFNSAYDKVLPSKKNFKQSKEIYINPTPLPSYVSSKKVLPKFFENKLSVTSPSPVPVNELINDISREYYERYKQQLQVNISQDVFNPNTSLGTLIEGTAAAASTESSATGPTINGLTSSQLSGVLIDSFIFDGSLENALNQVTQKAGLSWEWNGNGVEIYRTKVKNFYVAALATSGGEAGNNNQIKEMLTYLRSILSPLGKFSVMESSGIVTVRDTPLVLDTVEKALKELNAVLSKQIHINMEILEVEMSEEDSAGLEWDVIWSKALASRSVGYTSLSAPTGLNSMSVGITSGAFAGTSLNVGLKAVNANILSTKSHSIVTKNGKITPIKILDTTEYVRRLTKDTDDNGNITFTPEIANGETGLESKIQARIQPDGKILLKFDVKLKELKGLRDYVTNGETTQLADKTEKDLSQEIALQSGSSLVMSGIKTTSKTQNANGIGNPNFWLLGGNQSGKKKNTYLVVIATPYLVDN